MCQPSNSPDKTERNGLLSYITAEYGGTDRNLRRRGQRRLWESQHGEGQVKKETEAISINEAN